MVVRQFLLCSSVCTGTHRLQPAPAASGNGSIVDCGGLPGVPSPSSCRLPFRTDRPITASLVNNEIPLRPHPQNAVRARVCVSCHRCRLPRPEDPDFRVPTIAATVLFDKNGRRRGHRSVRRRFGTGLCSGNAQSQTRTRARCFDVGTRPPGRPCSGRLPYGVGAIPPLRPQSFSVGRLTVFSWKVVFEHITVWCAARQKRLPFRASVTTWVLWVHSIVISFVLLVLHVCFYSFITLLYSLQSYIRLFIVVRVYVIGVCPILAGVFDQ